MSSVSQLLIASISADQFLQSADACLFVSENSATWLTRSSLEQPNNGRHRVSFWGGLTMAAILFLSDGPSDNINQSLLCSKMFCVYVWGWVDFTENYLKRWCHCSWDILPLVILLKQHRLVQLQVPLNNLFCFLLLLYYSNLKVTPWWPRSQRFFTNLPILNTIPLQGQSCKNS